MDPLPGTVIRQLTVKPSRVQGVVKMVKKNKNSITYLSCRDTLATFNFLAKQNLK